MGRFSVSHSYSHRIKRWGEDDFEISWVFDRYFKGSRLRHPQSVHRWTDEAGARRFARKHGIAFPGVPQATTEEP